MTTTQHPERRAGQTWRRTIGGRHYDNVLKERADWGGEYVGWLVEGEMMLLKDDLWTGGFQGLTMILLDVPAAAPLAADRTKCKEWCGMAIEDGAVPFNEESYHYGAFTYGRGPRWCSPACRDARLPPLAAQPAETKSWLTLVMEDAAECAECIGSKFCSRHLLMYNREATRKKCGCYPNEDCQSCRTKPAPQPEPAKAVDMRPKCGNDDCETPYRNVLQRWCSFSDGMTPATLEWSCEPCHLRDEAEFAELMQHESTGTPYTGPERLERPKLAHSYGVEDPALEDAQ